VDLHDEGFTKTGEILAEIILTSQKLVCNSVCQKRGGGGHLSLKSGHRVRRRRRDRNASGKLGVKKMPRAARGRARQDLKSGGEKVARLMGIRR
jgi:hypothetical protein